MLVILNRAPFLLSEVRRGRRTNDVSLLDAISFQSQDINSLESFFIFYVLLGSYLRFRHDGA